jgi:SAM-dependent methyltransferase
MLKYKLEYEIDDVRTTLAHREIILNKPFLRKIYKEWYDKFIKASKTLPAGLLLEIGSGGGFLKEVFPEVITSDIQEIASCDKCLSAESLPFGKEEISGIFMINVFHHIPNPTSFLKEAQRTLKSGGKIIMVEPANSLWGRLIYKNFHHEPFDPQGGWTIPSTGPLSGANGAMPWIYFERDAEEFHKKFPQLKIESVKYHTPLRYLLSGGVSRKALVPLWSWNLFKLAETIITGISRQLSMFQTIVVVKR